MAWHKSKVSTEKKRSSHEIEAANRAEATAILIRAGYRVYRPEADVSGEDLVIRTPKGVLRSVQLKSRPTVEWRRYGKRQTWMLFPDPKDAKPGRTWYLIDHDRFYGWVKNRHGTAPKWQNGWSYPSIGVQLGQFLLPSVLQTKGPKGESSKQA